MSAIVSCCQPTLRRGRIASLCRNSASAGPLGLALLLPKCPLCIIAWAAALGVGTTWQRGITMALDPSVHPVWIALLASPILLRLVFILRRRTNSPVEKRTHV